MSVEGMMNQRLTIEPKLGVDDQGNEAYDNPVKVRGKVSPYIKTMTDDKGAYMTSHARLYLPPQTAIALHDRVTLPDGSTPSIMSISTVCDPMGVALYKVVLL